METLRAALDAAGFASTKLIAADSSFSGVAADVNADPVFAKALWGLGAHYPNMQSGPAAEATGKALWASEEDSTYNNAVGAACWARVINQNYVRGNMSSSINWNLISAYMKGTQWWRGACLLGTPRNFAAPCALTPPNTHPLLLHTRSGAHDCLPALVR